MTPSIDELAERGGEGFYRWFNQARVVVVFILGCVLIIYSVVESGTNIPYIIVGTVLIGLVPVDQWVTHTIGKDENGGNTASRHQ